jgi:uncharacterized RmlC-like cupin family protein
VLRSPLRSTFLGSPTSDLSICENVEVRSPLPRGGIPLHTHRSEDEAWYVLDGTLRFQYGRREFDAGAGSGVLLPRGTPHTFWNPGPGPARYLLIVRPKTAALLAALHATADYPPNLREVFDRYEVDLVE